MKRIALSFVLALSACVAFAQTGTPDSGRGIKMARGSEVILGENPDVPRYHALVIGIDRYRHWKSLCNARSDASEVGQVLGSRYGFSRVETLFDADATRSAILSVLHGFARTLKREDALLIFYAGHGLYDKDLQRGFWIPSEAREQDERGNPAVADWIGDKELIETTGIP